MCSAPSLRHRLGARDGPGGTQLNPRVPRAPAMASGPLPAWAAACFFVSGAAGLIYEVAWSKQLAYLLGNSLHAAATVVAAFLAGLALGARFLGVPLARRADGARIYALLELGIGLLGLLSLPVLRGLDPLVGSLYRSLGRGAGLAVIASTPARAGCGGEEARAARRHPARTSRRRRAHRRGTALRALGVRRARVPDRLDAALRPGVRILRLLLFGRARRLS